MAFNICQTSCLLKNNILYRLYINCTNSIIPSVLQSCRNENVFISNVQYLHYKYLYNTIKVLNTVEKNYLMYQILKTLIYERWGHFDLFYCVVHPSFPIIFHYFFSYPHVVCLTPLCKFFNLVFDRVAQSMLLLFFIEYSDYIRKHWCCHLFYSK